MCIEEGAIKHQNYILIALALALAGAGALLMWRPAPGCVDLAAGAAEGDLVCVEVNAHHLTFKELEDRAVTFMEDDRRTGQCFSTNETIALEHYRLHAARLWVYRMVMRDAAVAKGVEVTGEDEKTAAAATDSMLKRTRGITLAQFYAEGPLTAEQKQADARDAILIRKLLESEVDGAIEVKTDELESFMAAHNVSRSEAFMRLRQQKHNELSREYFRRIYPMAKVRSAFYPSLEIVEP